MLNASALWTAVALLVGCAEMPGSGAATYAVGHTAVDLDQYLTQRVRSGFSGVVLVARGGEIVLRSAYSRDPTLTVESAFWIGSVSKTITAAAVLALRDEGRISLGDSIGSYFSGVPPAMQSITVHQLLTHTAGLGENYAADGIADRTQAVRAVLNRPPARPPGTSYGYTNDGYNVLAALVEVAAGRPFEEYVRERILEPAGMVNTGFWTGPGQTATLAPAARASIPRENWGFRGATGLSSTVDDLYRWHLALEDDRVLADSTRASAFAPQVEKPGGGWYGYGWQVVRTGRGGRLLAHGGAESQLRHYAYFYRYVDDDVVVIMLANAREDVVAETFRGLLRALFPG